MNVLSLRLPGLKKITPILYPDERGFFFESYHQERYKAYGILPSFVQDNHSCSTFGTLRGMHFQSDPGQAKLVRVAAGKIFDVAVDMRRDSPTFGQWEGVFLDGACHEQLFIPVGFAHGFCVVSPEAHVFYKVTTPYCRETERGFSWNDPSLGISWPIDRPLLSERDAHQPSFHEVMREIE